MLVLERPNAPWVANCAQKPDTSLEKLVEFSEQDKRVKVIVNNRNFGHIKSPYWGVLQANGDAVICMASDLQDPPEIIADLAVPFGPTTATSI